MAALGKDSRTIRVQCSNVKETAVTLLIFDPCTLHMAEEDRSWMAMALKQWSKPLVDMTDGQHILRSARRMFSIATAVAHQAIGWLFECFHRRVCHAPGSSRSVHALRPPRSSHWFVEPNRLDHDIMPAHMARSKSIPNTLVQRDDIGSKYPPRQSWGLQIRSEPAARHFNRYHFVHLALTVEYDQFISRAALRNAGTEPVADQAGIVLYNQPLIDILIVGRNLIAACLAAPSRMTAMTHLRLVFDVLVLPTLDNCAWYFPCSNAKYQVW